jgi:NADH:ubiquinone oxidoreductase subunit 2 (subunit N)
MLVGVILLMQINISSISQLFINYNLISITNLSVFLLSLGGIPPLLGFIPKWLIIIRSRRERYFLVLILIFTSLISIFIYIRLIYPYIIFSPIKKKSSINTYQIIIGPMLGLRFLILIPIII